MERGRPGTVSLCPATGPSIWPKSAGRTRRHLERRRIVLKRFLIVLLATVCVASAQTLTQAERHRAINHLQTTPNLRAHAIDTPMGKTLDGYEWILFISAHTERHLAQIKEVKADSNFPKQ